MEDHSLPTNFSSMSPLLPPPRIFQFLPFDGTVLDGPDETQLLHLNPSLAGASSSWGGLEANFSGERRDKMRLNMKSSALNRRVHRG